MYFKALILALAFGSNASAKVFLTTDEALRQAFPGCRLSRETHYLTPSQLSAVKELSGSAASSALVIRHVAHCSSAEKSGTAYTETHRVRTHPETLFVLVDAKGELAKVEL